MLPYVSPIRNDDLLRGILNIFVLGINLSRKIVSFTGMMQLYYTENAGKSQPFKQPSPPFLTRNNKQSCNKYLIVVF